MTYRAEQMVADGAEGLDLAYAGWAAGDVDTLADTLDECRQAIHALAAFQSELVTAIASQAEVGTVIETARGRWRVKRRKGKVTWDHDALHRVLLARGRDARTCDEATGEYESEGEAVARVLMDCAGVGYWRVTSLARYGVDAAEYRSTDRGPVVVEPEEAPVTPESYRDLTTGDKL